MLRRDGGGWGEAFVLSLIHLCPVHILFGKRPSPVQNGTQSNFGTGKAGAAVRSECPPLKKVSNYQSSFGFRKMSGGEAVLESVCIFLSVRHLHDDLHCMYDKFFGLDFEIQITETPEEDFQILRRKFG